LPGLSLGTRLDALADGGAGGSAASDAKAGDEQGEVVITYPEGGTYKGQVLHGQRHGRGELKTAVTTYEGEWQADVQHGFGKQVWADRSYEGHYENGRFSGKGRMVWKREEGELVYEGQYKDDLKHGHGKFSWVNGRTYEGEWAFGQRHGKGVVQNQHGQRRACFYFEDKFERWGGTA